jgi:hypothetical protein
MLRMEGTFPYDEYSKAGFRLSENSVMQAIIMPLAYQNRVENQIDDT